MPAKVLLAQTHVVSNPYNKPKEVMARTVFCQTCDKAFNAKDWPTHERSKGHKAMKEQAVAKAVVVGSTQNEATTREERTANWADTSDPVAGGDWGATEGDTWAGDATKTGDGTGDWSAETVDAGGWTGDSGAAPAADGWGASDNAGNDGFNSAPRRNGGGNYGGNGGGRGGGGGGDGCYKCHQSGHFARECPNAGNSGGGGGSGGCFNCGSEGHMARDCTEPRKFTGTCNNCGEAGHRKGDCPKSAGGGRACYNCGMTDHISKECPEPRKPREGGGGGRTCHNCDQEGHISRDCPEPRRRDPRGPKCYGCNEYGHKKDQCTANGDAGYDNGYGNDGGFGDTTGGFEEAPTATGGWAGGNDDAAEASVEPSGDW